MEFELPPLRGLAVRVAGTLALALAPIGVIAIVQAAQIARGTSERRGTELLVTTAEAASGEALAISASMGAAMTLAAHVEDGTGDAGACSETFADVVDNAPQFSFAGYVDSAGVVRCASDGVGEDATAGEVWPLMLDEPTTMVAANSAPTVSGTSVIVSAAPVFEDDGTWGGFVTVSVPHDRIHNILLASSAGIASADTLTLTFNRFGQPLSLLDDAAALDLALPEGRSLADLVTEEQTTFKARTAEGVERAYAVVPVIPGTVYALGTQRVPKVNIIAASPLLFPAMMLIVGLVTALTAVNRLVIRQIRELIQHMAEFSVSRRILPLAGRAGLSEELREIDDAWTDLAGRIMRDEAEVENMVHEKNVLLKEVHHRVKNNLQLIASIVNLKIRLASSPEARRVLKEVQARVMSIAAVHQSLYAAPTSGKVRADKLLSGVIGGIIEAGTTEERQVTVTRAYEKVQLYPDQAVPFLLLATEAVTNALKYMGTTAAGEAWLDIRLRLMRDGQAELRIVNTKGESVHAGSKVAGSGLGQALIGGFATQLGGRQKTVQTDETYDFQFVFTPAPFDPGEGETTFAEFTGSTRAGTG